MPTWAEHGRRSSFEALPFAYLRSTASVCGAHLAGDLPRQHPRSDSVLVTRVTRSNPRLAFACGRAVRPYDGALCFTSVFVPATLQRWTVVDDAMGTLQCCGFMQTESSKSIEEHTFSPLLFCATGQRSFRLCTAWCTDIFQKHFELRRLRGLR